MTARSRCAALAVALGCAAACGDNEPPLIATVAGVGESGYDGDDPIDALSARMSLPMDVVAAEDGLYVVDWNNHRIRFYDPASGMLLHVAGRGELGGTLDDPANSDFNHPTGALLSPAGDRLYVAAWHNSKIRSIDLATGEIRDECGDGRRAYFGDDAAAVTASLDLPAAIAWDPDGNLAVMDQANQVIRLIDDDGVLHRIVGLCVTDETEACAAGVDPVPCPGGSGKFTCGDPATTCAAKCWPSYSPGTGALDLRMAQPFGQSADPGGRMAYDADGNLYFADSLNHIIRRVTRDGRVEVVAGVEPIDGVAQRGTSPDGMPATETLLDRPVDLALSPRGELFFTDVFNHCVRRIGRNGNVYTVAGVCGERGFAGDGGPAAAALLKLPYGIELDGNLLYIADSGNHRIRVVNVY